MTVYAQSRSVEDRELQSWGTHSDENSNFIWAGLTRLLFEQIGPLFPLGDPYSIVVNSHPVNPTPEPEYQPNSPVRALILPKEAQTTKEG